MSRRLEVFPRMFLHCVNRRSPYAPVALRETTTKEREAIATTGLHSLLIVREKLTSVGLLSSTAVTVVDPFGGRVVEFCWAGIVVEAMLVVPVCVLVGLFVVAPVVAVVAVTAVVTAVVTVVVTVVEAATLVLTSDTDILAYVAFPMPLKPCKLDTTLVFKDGICVASELSTVFTSLAEIVTLAMTEPEESVTSIIAFATPVAFATWVLTPSATEANKA
jgi:hypothetical protein